MPKNLIWTPELINRFWDGMSTLSVLEKLSFSRLAGTAITAWARPYLGPGARCLDYGGGGGHLAEALIDAGFSAACFETSRGRAELLERRLRAKDGFIGVIDQEAAGVFDAVFCIEVLEHILEGGLPSFLSDLNRRVKAGGLLLLTCPHNEDLDVSAIYCPVCDSTFHRWQHVRSLRAHTVRELLAPAGFELVWQGVVGFDAPESIAQFQNSKAAEWPNNFVDETGLILPIIGAGDRIAYVGRKMREPDQAAIESTVFQLGLGFDSGVLEAAVRAVANAFERARTVVGGATVILPQAPSVPIPSQVRTLVCPQAFDRRSPRGNGKAAGVETSSMSIAAPNTAVVYPSSLTEYEDAISRGILAACHEAHILDGGVWRVARRAAAASGTSSEMGRISATASPGSGSVMRLVTAAERRFGWLSYMARTASHLVTRWKWARTVQPRIDPRERALARLLAAPDDFPYRSNHFIEQRVVLAISSLSSGGAERQLLYTADGLRRRGIDDVHILVEYLHDGPENGFYLSQARHAANSITEVSRDKNPAADWANRHPALTGVMYQKLTNRILNIAAYLQRLAPEIVHVSLDWTNVCVGVAAALAGVPRIFLSGRNLAPWHFEFFDWFLYPAYRALLQHPTVRLANNSVAGATDYANWLGIDKSRIAVVRNGIDLGLFRPISEDRRRSARSALGVPQDSIVVAGAFRLSPEKRPLMWLETAARIYRDNPKTFFLVFGRGPLEASLKQHARNLGLGDRILFCGVAKDISAAFAAADLVMLASAQEGTPNVLIEAQAMGLPVVATAAYGSAEAIEDGITGRIVRAETSEALAVAALAVLRDDSFRARATEAGPIFVQRRFGMERMIDDTLALYSAAGALWARNAASADVYGR